MTFYGCTSLTSITIPNSVTSIGDWSVLWLHQPDQRHHPQQCYQHRELGVRRCTNLTRVYFKGNAPIADWTVCFWRRLTSPVYYLPGTIGWRTPTRVAQPPHGYSHTP